MFNQNKLRSTQPTEYARPSRGTRLGRALKLALIGTQPTTELITNIQGTLTSDAVTTIYPNRHGLARKIRSPGTINSVSFAPGRTLGVFDSLNLDPRLGSMTWFFNGIVQGASAELSRIIEMSTTSGYGWRFMFANDTPTSACIQLQPIWGGGGPVSSSFVADGTPATEISVMIAFDYPNQVVRYYLNGNQINSLGGTATTGFGGDGPTSTTYMTGNFTLSIGNNTSTSAWNAFNAVYVFNECLTLSDAKELYKNPYVVFEQQHALTLMNPTIPVNPKKRIVICS